jgi:hypothetical protein
MRTVPLCRERRQSSYDVSSRRPVAARGPPVIRLSGNEIGNLPYQCPTCVTVSVGLRLPVGPVPGPSDRASLRLALTRNSLSQVEHRDGQSLRLSDGNLNLSPGLLSRRLAASDSSLRLESLSLVIRHAMASGQLTSSRVRRRVESVPVNVRLADDHWHESPARRRGQAALTVTRTVTRGGF